MSNCSGASRQASLALKNTGLDLNFGRLIYISLNPGLSGLVWEFSIQPILHKMINFHTNQFIASQKDVSTSV